MKNKKILWIILIAIDMGITAFLFVVSIIMLAQTVGKSADEVRAATGFIGFLQNNLTVYLWAFVVPLFVLLAANIIGLVVYVRKTTKKEPVSVNDLSEAQREALRAELLKDLSKPADPQTEAPKEEEDK